MPDVHIVILAAGQGTRLKSARPKVLHHVAGTPMIAHVLEGARVLKPRSVTVVVGHQADAVKSALSQLTGLTYVVQEPQLGTGHALLTTEAALKGATGTVILLSGDVPLLPPKTLQALLDRHQSTGAAATVLTAVLDNPRGYGRVVRSGERIARIVEERDASSAERDIHEINSGIYAFTLAGLFEAVKAVAAGNAQGE
jgi:UDP-N-acetylglucosamine diphosphorylase/glucosamine-1-phosphate N-acetyltransferase